jgi:hypothetical protein
MIPVTNSRLTKIIPCFLILLISSIRKIPPFVKAPPEGPGQGYKAKLRINGKAPESVTGGHEVDSEA